MIVTCPWCKYEWDTRSKMRQITCPDCHGKFPQPAPAVRVLARNVSLNTSCTNCGRPMGPLNVCLVNGEPAFLCIDCLKDLTE